MEESNNIPALESAEELAWKQLRPYFLDPREDYPEPYHLLEYNGVPFSKVGGLAAIGGQKKNGKSFVLTQLMAAMVSDGNERTRQFLPGLTVPERTIEYLGHQPKVLYIDTEMEKLSSAKVLRRVHWLCGWDMKTPNERFSVLWLKNMPKDEELRPYKQRYDIIRKAIDLVNPDAVFIDGIRDLLSSINDEESAVKILEELGSEAEDRKMCIWNALHQNPSRNNDGDDKLRGWAGTELQNKVSDTLISIKKKDTNGVTFTVKQTDARDKDLEDWKFQITDDAGNLGVPKIIGGEPNRVPIENDPVDLIKKWVEDGARNLSWPLSRKDVKKKVFGDIGGQKNDGKQQADLQVAINLKYLVESTLKSGGCYMLMPADEFPF